MQHKWTNWIKHVFFFSFRWSNKTRRSLPSAAACHSACFDGDTKVSKLRMLYVFLKLHYNSTMYFTEIKSRGKSFAGGLDLLVWESCFHVIHIRLQKNDISLSVQSNVGKISPLFPEKQHHVLWSDSDVSTEVASYLPWFALSAHSFSFWEENILFTC